MSSDGLENTYSRPMAVETFSRIGIWDSYPNFTVVKEGSGIEADSHTESGRSDGFAEVHHLKGFPPFNYAIECKAFLGALKLGGDANEKGWHSSQRDWYRRRCLALHRPYYLYIWLYPKRALAPGERVYQKNAYVYLVPAEAYLDYEATLGGRKTIALTPELEREEKYRSRTVVLQLASYQLEYTPGSGEVPYWFKIPPSHHFYSSLPGDRNRWSSNDEKEYSRRINVSEHG